MKTAQNLGLLAVVVLSVFGHRSSAEPVVIDLGFLPGYSPSFANAISGDKQFVVGQSGPDGYSRAFIWDAENGMRDLGLPEGAISAVAYDVSWHGEVVVGVCEFADGSSAFIWTDEVGIKLIAPFTPSVYEAARGVSADGSVIVGGRWLPETLSKQAFRWTPQTGMEVLPVIPEHLIAYAYGVSADGTAVTGESGIRRQETRAAVWYDDQDPIDIGGLEHNGAYDIHSGVAIGSDGIAVAGNTLFDGFLWKPGQGVRQLAGGFYCCIGPWATSVSDGGYAATLSGMVIFGDRFALYWSPLAGAEHLDGQPPWGLGLEGWDFYSATDISPDGTAMVGHGYRHGAGEHAFLVTGLPSVRDICPPDMNTDGAIDMFDVQLFLGFYSEGDAEADFVPDGTIDFFDLQSFLNHYASGCG